MVDSKQFETKLVKVEFGKCRYNKRRENKIQEVAQGGRLYTWKD